MEKLIILLLVASLLVTTDSVVKGKKAARGWLFNEVETCELGGLGDPCSGSGDCCCDQCLCSGSYEHCTQNPDRWFCCRTYGN
uniref:Conotoxin Cal30 n=1 Tax=Californiconus californicus TaxID=1736779 RepID=C30_CONCL|nr:RecName: Full=Conotoxin Cal30; AltName: Full=O2_cal30; Flags: Precursor [Californiconus californicus]